MNDIDEADTTQDVVRVYDVTEDGYLRVERVRRQRGRCVSGSTTEVGVVDIEALAVFPDDVPTIDMADCPDDLAAFGKELVA